MNSFDPSPASPPSAFISYSHDDEDHKRWVQQLATHLRLNGIDAKVDVWEAPLGTDFANFMEQLPNCDFAIPICTKRYCEKSKSRKPSGVRWESQLITNLMYQNISEKNDVRVIPILRGGATPKNLPTHLQNLHGVDFSDDEKYADNLEKLLTALHRIDNVATDILEPHKDGEGCLRIRLEDPSKKKPRATRPKKTEPNLQKPKVTPWADSTGSQKNYGIIITADVVDSSSLKGKRLQTALEEMSEFVRSHPLTAVDSKRSFHCLLDSFVIVLPDCDAYTEVLDFTVAWVHHMQSSMFKLDIRAAVHFGTYFFSDALNMVIGAGPNECSRIVRLAGENQVLVSEQFIHELRKEDDFDGADPGKFTPDLSKRTDPLEIQMKQGQLTQIRIYDTGLNPHLPYQLQQIEDADRALWQTLESIDNFFVNLIAQANSGLVPKLLRQRVSIFAPNHNSTFLVCTEFRRSKGVNGHSKQRNAPRRKSSEQLNEKGRTRYPIGGGLQPAGPLGLAYKRKKPVALNGLPDYKLDPYGYIRRLKQRPYGVDEETIAGFGRHARCFLAVPCSFSDQVECVICVDTEAALENVTHDELIRIGRWIQVVYELRIASLWRLRT